MRKVHPFCWGLYAEIAMCMKSRFRLIVRTKFTVNSNRQKGCLVMDTLDAPVVVDPPKKGTIEVGPLDRFASEITTSLIAGGLGLALLGPTGAAVGAAVGAASGAIGQYVYNNSHKNQKTPSV